MNLKVLHLILHHHLFPPKNGGMLRCWNLMEQVSKNFDVDVITLQNNIANKIRNHSFPVAEGVKFLVPAMFARNVGKVSNIPLLNKLLIALQYRWLFKTASAADAGIVQIIPIIRSLKKKQYDYVLFEHLESLKTYKLLRRFFPGAKFIFDAHNADHILLKNTAPTARVNEIKKIESTLYRKCDIVLSCSNEDRILFDNLNQSKLPVLVVPNGVDIYRNPFHLPDFDREEVKLIFCGSLDYGPNARGLTWFLQAVWPEVLKTATGAKLLVVGKGQPEIKLSELLYNSPGVELIGEVDEVIPYYRQCQCAIVPLLEGSGTRLKVLEAMSLGVPVLSTAVGAEGIACTNGQNILICNTTFDYISAIGSFKASKQTLVTISKNGRRLVEENYSWNVIGTDLYRQLGKLRQAV